jgi:hypothetical protein
MPLPTSSFERRMRPFIALQAGVSALGSFAGVFVYASHGSAGVARCVALMLGTASLCIIASFALGTRIRISSRRLIQLGFAVPALLLWWAEGRPDVLALAIGSFLGLTWGARHWLELQCLGNAERDSYATHAIALSVGVALLSTLAVSALLSATRESHRPVYLLFAVLSLIGVLFAARHLPEAPPVRLEKPRQVLLQPAYRDCLPLFFLESGLIGIAQVLTASGAVHALSKASTYGWAVGAATGAGALALRALHGQRHSENRVGWMRAACVGIVCAAALLGASAIVPGLFVLHLLLQACVGPFWSASEHVLNQRAMDIHGAIGDRIMAREGALGLFRFASLALFWWATQRLADQQRLMIGASLMALAAILEFRLGSRWLSTHPASTLPVTV